MLRFCSRFRNLIFSSSWIWTLRSQFSTTALFCNIKKRLTLDDFFIIARNSYECAIRQCQNDALGPALYWILYYKILHHNLLTEYKKRGFITYTTWMFYRIIGYLFQFFELFFYLLDVRKRQYGVYVDDDLFQIIHLGEAKFAATMTCANPNLKPFGGRYGKIRSLIDISFVSNKNNTQVGKHNIGWAMKLVIVKKKVSFPYLSCRFIEEVIGNTTVARNFLLQHRPSVLLLEESLDKHQLTLLAIAKELGIKTLVSFRGSIPYLPFYYFGADVAVTNDIAFSVLSERNMNVRHLRDSYSIDWRTFCSNRTRPVNLENTVVGYGPEIGNFLINKDSKEQFDKIVLSAFDCADVKCKLKLHPQEGGMPWSDKYYLKLAEKHPSIISLDGNIAFSDFLRNIDVWVCFVSTTAYQAALSKVPVILINFEDDKPLGRFVDNSAGLVSYANDAEHLLYLIEENRRLVNDREHIDKLWSQMLSNLGIDKKGDGFNAYLRQASELEEKG